MEGTPDKKETAPVDELAAIEKEAWEARDAVQSRVEGLKKETAEAEAALESARKRREAADSAFSREKARLAKTAADLADARHALSVFRAERLRLETEAARMREAVPVVVSFDESPSDRTILLAVRLKSAVPAPPPEPPAPEPPPAPAGPEPRPEAEDAFPEIPEPGEAPPVGDEPIEWAFAQYRKNDAVVVPAEALSGPDAPPLFFVGDLHGDSASLRAILRKVWTARADSRIVFLGDIFDRGPDSLGTVRLFLWAARTRPGRVLWLRGNHDDLRFDEETGKFVPAVDPHEFVDWLEEHPEHLEEAKKLAGIIRTLPLAAVLGPVWASHGGIPHEDVCGDFAGFGVPLPEPIRQDFVWSRMKDARSKLPNRLHKGAEVGQAQAKAFIERLRETEGIEVKHLVCAHQHEHSAGYGYLDFVRFFKGNPTCQCICSFRDADAGFEPVVLRWRAEGMPAPIRFPAAAGNGV